MDVFELGQSIEAITLDFGNTLVPFPSASMSGVLAELLKEPGQGLQALGPAEAPVPRLKNEFRYQMLIKARSRPDLNTILQRLQRHALEEKWPATALVVDVDPLNLL